MARGSVFVQFRDDVRFAFRQLRRAPAFAIVAAVTLALGIGANSAIFALVDAALLRPLPFPHADRLVRLSERTATRPQGPVAPLNMRDWNERSAAFEQIAGFVPGVGGMVMTGADGLAETVPRQWVTSGFFSVLGVTPVVGRTFLPDDDAQRRNAVVFSEAFWRTRFNGDPAIVGRDVRLDGVPYTVVGVAPRGFQLLGRTSMWALVPIVPRPALRTAYVLQAIGRMKPDVTIDAARADLATVAATLARELPATNAGRGVAIDPLHDALIGRELRATAMLFLGVVGVVLLICCANVANLLLARASGRSRELAVRTALGAARARIVRQLATESLVLAAIGGVLGIGLGAAIVKAAPALLPDGLLPAAVTITFDLRVLGFCVAAAVVAALLFGVAPAWQATDLSAAHAMASDARTSTASGSRLRRLLVVAQVSTAVILLVGAGLLLRTLLAVENVDRGYRAERVLTMMVDPLGSKYPTPPQLLQFYDDVEREVRALPGVRSVAWTTSLPLGASDLGSVSVDVVGDAPLDERERPTGDFQIVSHGYFDTLDLPIVAGRGFTARDVSGTPAVCIVNEAFVRGLLGGRSPIGMRVATRPVGTPQAKPQIREIVGVARQVKARPDETQPMVQIYVPLAQNALDDIYMAVRPVSERVEGLPAAVRGAIARVDKEQLVSVRDVMTLDDVAWEATSRHRMRALMVTTFAGLALLLAMVGVFGVLAYSVQQRVRELGVRRALGATTGSVLRLVLQSATRVVGTGAVIGLVLAALLARFLVTMLFGVEPLDATTFAAVAIVLIVTGAIAIAAPAWRAARIDPAVALRNE